jgi:hypothetical protein
MSMSSAHVDDFTQEKACEFRGEEYLVRDNGAVRRCSRRGRRRPLDDK